MSGLPLADRLAGASAPADGALSEGRWRVTRAVTYNGHTRLEPGDLLLGDGTPGLRLDGATVTLRTPRLADAAAADLALALTGIRAIAARTNLGAGPPWPSPVLPSELRQETDRTGLDAPLALALEQGHLDGIARRPRLNLRCDTELLAVDRARRLATGFQRHLAAHSECWAARRLHGIVPKAVLARVSDDDADLYEHRVYARLLDHLERHLCQRIRRIERLTEGYEQALAFNNAERVDWRLRHAICALWGAAVSPDEAHVILDHNRELLERLRRWLKRLRGLKGYRAPDLPGSLYDSIPRGATVDLNLQPTNLLQHDPHYRHLRLLWRAWLDATASSRERPEQVLQRRRAEQQAFEGYVGLLLVRALTELGFQVCFTGADQARAAHDSWNEQLALRHADHAWTLTDGQRTLALVPAALALDAEAAPDWRTRVTNQAITIPCVPWSAAADQPPTRCLEPDHPALVLSPLDLYCEERMIALVSAWCWQGRLADYGKPFARLPRAVADAWPKNDLADFAIRQPLSSEQWSVLHDALSAHANHELRERLERTRQRVERLAQCPVCDAQAQRFSPSADGFFARCDGCDATWRLKQGRFRVEPPGGENGFLATGRHAIDAVV